MEVDLGFKPRDDKRRGDFGRIHLLPRSGADVPDDLDTRLVVLDIDHPYAKEEGNQAEVAAKAILESRGNSPRIYRNTLVFLAADKVRLQDLDEALRRFLAWQSILDEKVELNLDPHQVRQAETQKGAADGAVAARLPETYQWVLVPAQTNPKTPVQWIATRLSGTESLAVRVTKKLRGDDLLIANLGATIVRKYLDEIPLWRGNHVAVRQLADDFAQQLYLPRLLHPSVLADSMRTGVAFLTWQMDTFAYAESFDATVGRYLGLQAGQQVTLAADDVGLLVMPDIASTQLDADAAAAREAASGTSGASTGPTPIPRGAGGDDSQPPAAGGVAPTVTSLPRRYHGTVRLDPTRVGRDASEIAAEVIAHLSGLVGSDITVTLDIEARLPDGATEQVVRTVTENGRTLKFELGSGFERE